MTTSKLAVALALVGATAFGAGDPAADAKGDARPALSKAERVAIVRPAEQGVLLARPTFNSCGVCFGAKDAVDGLELQYRAKGARNWQTCREFPHFDGTGDYRGSILRLKEGADYDCRVFARGKVLAETGFRTWASEVPVARTVLLDETATFPIRVTEKGGPDGWIRYAAKPGFVLDNRTESDPCFILDGAERVVFDGLTIRGSGARNVFALVGSREVRIRNCDISRWGRAGAPRFDLAGRMYETDREPQGDGIDFDGAIDIGRGCSCVVVERCFVHDPRGRANSWFYSRPAGPAAVTASSPDHSTVIRWNDFVGSDLHRWRDAVGAGGGSREDGGFNRDADIYGNFMIFCNDDCVELDGGQQDVRCFDNRFESALCGVSLRRCMVSPSYVDNNGFFSMCEEFGAAGPAIGTDGAHGEEACAFVTRNLLWGRGAGVDWTERLRIQQRFNTFCDGQRIGGLDRSPLSVSESDSFGVRIDERNLPAELPVRPLGFTLDRARFGGVRVAKGAVEPKALSVTARGGATATRFRVAKCEAFDWFDVRPAEGTIPARGKVVLKVAFRPERMADRRDYRGAFLVRTPEGLSRPVSLYAETDFVPPYHAEKPGDVALYADGFEEGTFAPFRRLEVKAATFDVPKDGRYYFMVHSKDAGALEVAVDEDEPAVSRQQNRDYPTWTMLAPGRSFGNMCRHYDLKAGKHVVTIRCADGDLLCDGLVLTDNPLSFEPR